MKKNALQLKNMAGSALLAIIVGQPSSVAAVTAIDQGWTSDDQRNFYSLSQGSQIMPLSWISALKQPNGAPFMAASLNRYGYLENETSDPKGLPVGFTVANGQNGEVIGMTCAACHTRQIDVAGTAYRIDGGPAIVDFQSFAADLDQAVNTILSNDQAFADFAHAVLGPSSGKEAQLHAEVKAWHLGYHTLMDKALPKDQPWGPARLDAVSMIFNRLTGLDIGTSATHLIPDNIYRADAPVRYPFLWNAAIQDKTQWPGFADNGNDILGLARNLGEVYGVFGAFYPIKDDWRLLGIDYLKHNSANFHGLGTLENLIKKLKPPKWPWLTGTWAINPALAGKGKIVFERPTDQGGCIDCHGIKPGKTRFFEQKTWATPILDVGTDSREYGVLARTVDTGVLKGANIPFLTQPLKAKDSAFSVLGLSVIGAILQHYVPIALTAEEQAAVKAKNVSPFTPETEALKGAFNAPPPAPSFAYESRVLQGIWATAPYLHNGSVPSLAELLKPAVQRVAAFKVGPVYDPVNVGLAADQTQFNYTLKTTDCSDRNSGNSRCGHEFGTTLSSDDKTALLEYLKSL